MTSKIPCRNMAVARAQLDSWSNLLKLGHDPIEAMAQVGIEDLNAIIIQSGYRPSESESETTDHESLSDTDELGDRPNSIEDFIRHMIVDAYEEGMRQLRMQGTAQCKQTENGGGDQKVEISQAVKESIDTTMQQLTMDDDKDVENIVEEIVEWQLCEAEHCAYTLLMASGHVLVDQFGEIDMNFLWTKPGHELLFDSKDPINGTMQRLTIALKSLRLLYNNAVIRSAVIWNQRRSNVFAMIAASGYAETIGLDLPAINNPDDFPASTLNIESFEDVIADNSGRQEMYLLKHGLPGYMDGMQRLFGRMSGTHWNLNILTALTDASDLMCGCDQVCTMVQHLGAAKNVTDIRVGNSYFALFRAAFHNLKFGGKKRVMQCFYEHHHTPLWQMMDKDLEANLTIATNKLSAQERSKEYLQKLADEFCWPFMISLKFTWWHLLKNILRMPVIIPIIIEILRQLEPVTAVCLNGNDTRLSLVGVRRLVDEKVVENEEYQANWIRLVSALTSTRSWLSKRKPSLTPVQAVITKAEAISTLILPLMDPKPLLALRALLAIIDETPEQGIQWTNTDDDNQSGTINAAKVFTAIIEAFVKSKKEGPTFNTTVTMVGLETLNLLVAAWKADEVLFSDKEVEALGRRYETLPWTIRCLVYGHLHNLSKEPVRIPVSKCLMENLHLPENEYRCADCDDWATDHSKWICSLTGLFQMASVNLEMAEDMVKNADIRKMADQLRNSQLKEPMIEAMVHVLIHAQSIQEWRNCSDLIVALFDRLKVEAGQELGEAFGLRAFSMAMRVVAPAVQLSEAVGRMIALEPGSAETYVRNFAIVAKDTIMERMQASTDPLIKFFIMESLFVQSCALASALKQPSTELGVLLVSIASGLKKECNSANMSVFKTVAKAIPPDDSKEKLMELLECGA